MNDENEVRLILVDRIRAKRAGRPPKREDRLMDFTFIRRESDAPPSSV